jgi:hypothetical protein
VCWSTRRPDSFTACISFSWAPHEPSQELWGLGKRLIRPDTLVLNQALHWLFKEWNRTRIEQALSSISGADKKTSMGAEALVYVAAASLGASNITSNNNVTNEQILRLNDKIAAKLEGTAWRVVDPFQASLVTRQAGACPRAPDGVHFHGTENKCSPYPAFMNQLLLQALLPDKRDSAFSTSCQSEQALNEGTLDGASSRPPPNTLD